MFKPSKHQQALFDWGLEAKGSAIVRAVAGSGKSTSIRQLIAKLPTGVSVLVLSFNADITKDMNAKLEELKPAANVSAKTFHAVGLGAVTKRLGKRPDVNGNKCRDLLRNLVSPLEYAQYSDFVLKLIDLAKGEGIAVLISDADENWFRLIAHHNLFLDDEKLTEDRAISIARDLLKASNAAAENGSIDFNDMLYLPLLWKCKLWQHDWVFVDEAQDTNPVRRALARLALRPGGRLVAVGDPRQAIYGFTGASHDAMDLIKSDFDCVELPLTVSYRCPKAVVTLAQEIVSDIEAFEGAPEGKVEDAKLKDVIPRLTKNDAVLCRNTAPLLKLAYGLIAQKVPCHVLGREIGTGLTSLIKKQNARGIDHLQKKLDDYKTREVARFTAKGEEQKAEAVVDRVECINVVISGLSENERTVPKLISTIESMFSDNANSLTLATCHKAKGKEWPRVAIIRPDLMPSKWARQAWQVRQEMNLLYVAYTRAQEELIFITDAE